MRRIRPRESTGTWRLLPLAICLLAGVCSAGSSFPDRPYMTLEDRNVTYIALDGTDPQLDDHHVRPERILLRIFLTAMHESSRSLTASADPPESQILVRATINRESLDEQPEWGVTGNPRHFYSCVAHRWQPRFFLRSDDDGESFPLAFVDQIPGVPWYFRECPRPGGGYDPADNIKPYFMQGHVPANYSGKLFKLHVAGWPNHAPLRLNPQLTHPETGEQEFWNIIQLAGNELQPELRAQYASTVAMHTEYHLHVGMTGTVCVADFETIRMLTDHPASMKLIQSGRLVPLLWEGYSTCTAAVCFGEQRMAVTVRALYAPLTYTVASFFLWNTFAYVGLVDLDEFLFITRPMMSIQQLLVTPECFDRWPYVQIERFGIQPLVPTQETAHALWWADKKRFTAKQVLSQYEYTAKIHHMHKAYAAVECIEAASIHDVLVVNSSMKTIVGRDNCAYIGHAHSWWVYREFEELPRTRQDTRAYYEDRRWMWALDMPIPPAQPSRLLAHTRLAGGEPKCKGLNCALRSLALRT